MKLLTKKSEYAIRALLELSKNNNVYVSARLIAYRQKIPYQFLRKILQILLKKKLVKAREGNRGGFKITKELDQIRLMDIVEIFQGKVKHSDLLVEKIVADWLNDLTLKGILDETT